MMIYVPGDNIIINRLGNISAVNSVFTIIVTTDSIDFSIIQQSAK